MLEINRNNITLTRGDAMTLTVGMVKNGQAYTPAPEDVIRFAVSTGYKGDPNYSLIYSTEIDHDSLTFTVANTSGWTADSYNYDVEITYEDGTPDTFISGQIYMVGECK